MTDPDNRSAAWSWWNWRLFGRWMLVNAAAYVVIVVGGVALEEFAWTTTRDLADDHRLLVVLLVAIVGAGFQGTVLGRWQWRILRERVPDLPRRRWVMATLVPSFLVWLLAIAPGAVDLIAQGGAHSARSGMASVRRSSWGR